MIPNSERSPIDTPDFTEGARLQFTTRRKAEALQPVPPDSKSFDNGNAGVGIATIVAIGMVVLSLVLAATRGWF